MNKCLYNLELLILGTGNPPWQNYNEPIKPETPANYVYQLKDTDVDTLMICPTAWKRPLWDSKIDPHWKEEADSIPQPHFTSDLKYHEKAYFRLREFIKAGNDPVQIAVDAAKETGLEPFISYRMNDHHYLHQEKAFIHPSFWRNNPQFWIGEGDRHFSYKNPEVRQYYYSLLEELTSKYDISGIELDFMRTPKYFHPDDVEQGREIMTEFVGSIRKMLDSYGHQRGKRLKLCVRVPHTVSWAKSIGLEVGLWDELGLIDMVNVSSYFINTPDFDVEGYKQWVKQSPLYAEMHFIIDKGEIYNGFSNNVSRKTTKEMYRALASNYLDRGMDGISFFNIDYTRHHFFNEPRRLHLKDGQPPISAFKGITDINQLAKFDKHYFAGPNYTSLPMTNTMELNMYVGDKNPSTDFKHSILRIKTQRPCQGFEFQVKLNGTELEEMVWLGELFAPISDEALPRREYVRCYKVPTSLIKHGYNCITAVNLCDDPTLWDKEAKFDMVELALYKNNSFLD